MTVVDVEEAAEVGVGVDGNDGVIEMAPAGIGVGLFGPGVVAMGEVEAAAGEGGGEAVGLARIVVFDIVPAVDEFGKPRVRLPDTGAVILAPKW